jgi:two-component system, OmpR family, sensor kinase
VRGQLEVIADELDGDQRDAFAVATGELDRMARIVDDLLLLARLDEGMELRREPVEVELVLGEASLRAMLLAPRDVRVETESGLFVLADRDRVLQVLSNLVTNAVQHTDESGRIVLAAEQQNGRVLLHVSDDGRGIAPDDLPHVFERLYRGRNAGGETPGGSGLGLAIAASIVTAMDGTIEARSKPDAGAMFTVALPRAEPMTPSGGYLNLK